MIPFPKQAHSMAKNNKKQVRAWRTWSIAAVIAGGGAITISAGDSYFEISKNLEIFTELYKELNIYYVDDTQPGKLMKTGIDAMLNSLDPYTQYIPESDMEDYRFMTTGQYGGVGALIKRKDDKILVSEPYENYPAMKAGIWAGDEIVEVDGRKIAGMNTDEVSKLLKGQAGSTVKVVTRRDGAAPVTHELVREEIKIPDVPYKGIVDATNHVGYIKLNSFTQTAGQEVRTALKELKEQGATHMILDLRGNGGGLQREAVNIVNLFVPKNELVVETKGKIAEWDKTYKTLSEPMGLPTGPGYQVACTDPAILSGNRNPVGVTVPSKPFADGVISLLMRYTTFPDASPTSSSTWTTSAGRSTGRCTTTNGTHRLHLTMVRPQHVNELPLFDTHLLDMNVGLDRLVAIAHNQIESYTG